MADSRQGENVITDPNGWTLRISFSKPYMQIAGRRLSKLMLEWKCT